MGRVVAVLFVCIVVVLALGFYLDWFHFTKSGDSNRVNLHVTVDKDKIAQDEKNVERKLEAAGREIKKTAEKVAEDIKGAPKQAPPADNGQTAATYHSEASGKLDAMEVRLAELKARIAQLSDDAKANLQKKLDQLNAKKDEARRDLAELKTTSGDKAEAAKARLQAALDDLQKGIDRLAAELK